LFLNWCEIGSTEISLVFLSEDVEELRMPHISDLLIPKLANTKLTLKVLHAYIDFKTDVKILAIVIATKLSPDCKVSLRVYQLRKLEELLLILSKTSHARIQELRIEVFMH
jgi:hypothetical protein